METSFEKMSKECDMYMSCTAWYGSRGEGHHKTFHVIKRGWDATVKNANRLINKAYNSGVIIDGISVTHFDFKTGEMIEFE